MNSSKVSVIVSVCDKEDYIFQSLSSVLKQSFQNWECLIIDDGSKDKSFEIIKLFSLLDKRFKIFRNKSSQGTSKALNKVLSEASGELICQLDGDDILPIHALNRLVNYLTENQDIDFLYTDGQWIDSRGNYIRNKSYQYKKPCDPIFWLIHPCALHFKMWRNCELRFDENVTFGEDWDFNLNLMLKYKPFHLREIHYLQRYCPFSKSWQIPSNLQSKDLQKIDKKWRNKYLFRHGLPRLNNWIKYINWTTEDA